MNQRSGILAGGNWIVDKLKVIDVYPQQDALANILSQSIGNGGSPFNLLVDLARLRAPFALGGIGLIGADADGDWIEKECHLHGIDTTQLRRHPDAPTSYTDVMTVKSTARRTFFHQRGANAFLAPGDFAFTGRREKIFHLGYLLLLDTLDLPDADYGTGAGRLFAQAHAAGFQTSVDLVSEDSQRFTEVVLPTLPYVDYCILNEFELERTAGVPARVAGAIDLDGVRRGADQLLVAGVRQLVIVHFPEGACALSRCGEWTVCGSALVPEERILSTVGAGDAFAAGVLFGLHEERPIEEALQSGIAAAAACLLGRGASDGLRPLEECAAMVEAFGSRDLRIH